MRSCRVFSFTLDAMNLASPAPAVESVTVKSAPSSGRVLVDAPATSGSVRVSAAAAVEPATFYDTSTAPRSKPSVQSSVSAQALKGKNGADFESYVALLRGAPPKNGRSRSEIGGGTGRTLLTHSIDSLQTIFALYLR